ncbi:protein phosphatase [Rhodovulum sp. NI22]|nr:protein phosphatase [Rhodovulum sp. NI22]
MRLEEAREDARPLLIPVLSEAGPGTDTLYLGNLIAAEDAMTLGEAGVTASLNLAMNVFPCPLTLPDGSTLRRYQIGMLDGAGNMSPVLAAAVNLIDALTEAYTEGKPHYPPHRKGNLLVHCRGGRSRSVTVLALWLHLRRPERFPHLETALDYLRGLRGLGGAHPLPPMITLAHDALAGPLAHTRPQARP